jgi:lysophospholipase L1-like esterase
MKSETISRRNLLSLGVLGAMGLGVVAFLGRPSSRAPEEEMLTVYTFGDSILDCGHYNRHGVHPGGLLVRNDDALFPEFKGKDLSSAGPARLEHRAQDGATVDNLPGQARGLTPEGRALALLTIGGNDLLSGLVLDGGAGIELFARKLESFLKSLAVRPVYIGNVYDPSFGNDENNFLGVDPQMARLNHGRVNAVLADAASRYGQLVDLHTHFMKGDPSWYTHTIEPSLEGASEVRRAFLEQIIRS